MKNMRVMVTLAFPILIGAACDDFTPVVAKSDQDPITENTDLMIDTLVIKVGGKEFTATLPSSPTATAFKALLPLTMNMTELNGNEKYFSLSRDLPANELNPGTINSGDLMLYGSNTMVLFYENFRTSYSYTKLGTITDVSGLAAAVGKGNVTVRIELK
jgi:hypothetical protein